MVIGPIFNYLYDCACSSDNDSVKHYEDNLLRMFKEI